MEIRPHENLIAGAWILVDGRMIEDDSVKRIRALVDRYLQRVAVTPDGWESLYRDPTDGRYWEMTDPYGEMQGGGPASLRVLDVAAAREKYRVDLQ